MKIIVILSKGYFCREPLNTGEGWQVLEPDRLVMQIALAIGERLIMKSLQSQSHITAVTK